MSANIWTHQVVKCCCFFVKLTYIFKPCFNIFFFCWLSPVKWWLVSILFVFFFFPLQIICLFFWNRTINILLLLIIKCIYYFEKSEIFTPVFLLYTDIINAVGLKMNYNFMCNTSNWCISPYFVYDLWYKSSIPKDWNTKSILEGLASIGHLPENFLKYSSYLLFVSSAIKIDLRVVANTCDGCLLKVKWEKNQVTTESRCIIISCCTIY